LTQRDDAACGQASSTKNSDSSSAARIDDHNAGLTASPVWSRNTSNARRWCHGLANRCKPRCNAGANAPSAAWLYEMNAS
jgi:hypothetical protein